MIIEQTTKSRTFDRVTAFNAWDVKGMVSLNTTPSERLSSFVEEIKEASGYPYAAGERYLTGDYIQAVMVKHRLIVPVHTKDMPIELEKKLSKLARIVQEIKERLAE